VFAHSFLKLVTLKWPTYESFIPLETVASGIFYEGTICRATTQEFYQVLRLTQLQARVCLPLRTGLHERLCDSKDPSKRQEQATADRADKTPPQPS
jgi:hypothetical protein